VTTKPSPPAHLSLAARRLFSATLGDYVLEPHQVAILTKALEAFDRAEQARLLVDAEGLVIETRLGERKPHPAVSIERDSRTAFLAGMKQLGLDYEVVTNGAKTASARAARWNS
jgi:phage terminase small subunit